MTVLADALAAHLRRLPSSAVTELARAVLDSPGMQDVQAKQLVSAMADPAWPKGVVERLSPTARAGLRLVCALPLGAFGTRLDRFARRLAGDTSDRSAAEELRFHGVVHAVQERAPWGERDARLRVLEPLRAKWNALAGSTPSGEPPPPPTSSELAHADVRPAYVHAVAAAALASIRPRVTRSETFHRSDLEALRTLLAPLFSDEDALEDALLLLVKSRLFRLEGGRAALVADAAGMLDDGPWILLRRRLHSHRHHGSFGAGLARIASAEGWVSERELLYLEAIRLLPSREPEPPRSLPDLIAASPGTLVCRRGDERHFHATPALHFAFGETNAPPRPASGPLLVQPNMHVLAQVDTPPSVVVQLGRVCRLVSVGEATVFALEEAAVRRSASEGFGATELLAMLERHAPRGVPAVVARAIGDWTRTKGAATLVTGTVLLTELEEATLVGFVDRSELTPVAKGAWLVDEDVARELVKALRAGGVRTSVPVVEESRRARWNEDGWDDAKERLRELADDARRALAGDETAGE